MTTIEQAIIDIQDYLKAIVEGRKPCPNRQIVLSNGRWKQRQQIRDSAMGESLEHYPSEEV